MKKLFLTGASGFLGGHIFSSAQSRFQTLGTFLNYPYADIPNWRKIDLGNFFDVFELVMDFNPDVIIHAAANSNLDDCERHPEAAREANVQATANLVGIAAQMEARFIFVSSDMVFDGSGSRYGEEEKTQPISVYGKTKRQAERMVQRVENSVIVRSALIYGRRKIGGSSFSMWMEDRLRNNVAVPLYHDQFRSPVLADNLAQILLELAESAFTGVLHVGSSNRINRLEFGQQLCEIGGYDAGLLQSISMHDQETVAPRPQDVSLDCSRANSVLSTKLLSTQEGLEQMFRSD